MNNQDYRPHHTPKADPHELAMARIVKLTGMRKKGIIDSSNVKQHFSNMAAETLRFFRQTGKKGVVVPFSAGIDSTTALLLFHAAGIPVLALIMPDWKSMDASGSKKRAVKLCKQLGIKYRVEDVGDMRTSVVNYNDNPFRDQADPTVAELSSMNTVSRLRMVKAREVAQNLDHLLACCDNLSEYITGNFCKEQDRGDIRPMILCTKGELRILAAFLGVLLDVMDLVQETLDAIPSAELKPDQSDEAEYGFIYKLLDDWILNYTSGNEKIDALIERRVKSTQHKRNLPMHYDCSLM